MSRKKPAPDLIRGGYRFSGKDMRQRKNLECIPIGMHSSADASMIFYAWTTTIGIQPWPIRQKRRASRPFQPVIPRPLLQSRGLATFLALAWAPISVVVAPAPVGTSDDALNARNATAKATASVRIGLSSRA